MDGEVKNEKSYLRKCMVAPRDGEVLFEFQPDGSVTASLDRYAVIPNEEYVRLKQIEDKDFKLCSL